MGKDLKGKELGAGISQRKSDGLYMARYKGKCRYAQTLKEIKTVYRQLVYDVDNHLYIDKNTITLTDYFNVWLQSLSGVKGSTKAAYKNWFKWVDAELGKSRVQAIEKIDVRNLQAILKKKNMKPSTINSTLGILYQIMKQARADGIIAVNPCEDIKSVKQSKKDSATKTIHRALTKEEQKVFMEYAKDEWLYNMIDFMLRTGMRIGEARALQWRDIDYHKGIIHVIRNASYDENNKTIITTPKTETSLRDIPLTKEIKEVLSRQRQRNLNMFGNVQAIDGTVFLDLQGRMVPRGSMKYTVKKIFDRMRAAGLSIEPISPHGLRDTFATRAIEAGMQPQTLKAILGHSSLAMTMDLYAQVLPNTKKEEMEKIAAAF